MEWNGKCGLRVWGFAFGLVGCHLQYMKMISTETWCCLSACGVPTIHVLNVCNTNLFVGFKWSVKIISEIYLITECTEWDRSEWVVEGS